jgi:hypothetical protein
MPKETSASAEGATHLLNPTGFARRTRFGVSSKTPDIPPENCDSDDAQFCFGCMP